MAISKTLVAKEGPLAGKAIHLLQGQAVTIGSTPKTTWRVTDDLLSGTPIIVELQQAKVMLNGPATDPPICLNGKPLTKATPFHVGDTLEFGEHVLTLEFREILTPFKRLQKKLAALQGLPTHERRAVRYPSLIVEAFALTSIALFVVSTIGVGQAGFFGLFLAAASLTTRFQALLQENKDAIFVHKTKSSQANATTALSILMIFIGLCLAYLLSTMVFSADDLEAYFGFIFQSTKGLSGTLLDRNFSAFFPILTHNLVVMGTIAVLCLLYRSYGALLTLGWNACIWVIVLVTLTRPLLANDPISSIPVAVWALASVGPHLVLEGAAYVFIALAAIFYSKGVTRYFVPLAVNLPSSTASLLAQEKPRDTVFYDITIACLKLVLTALFTLLIATCVEVFWATWMLSLLKNWVTV